MIQFVSIDSDIKPLEEMESLCTIRTEKAPRAFDIFVKTKRSGSREESRTLLKSSSFGGSVNDLASVSG